MAKPCRAPTVSDCIWFGPVRDDRQWDRLRAGSLAIAGRQAPLPACPQHDQGGLQDRLSAVALTGMSAAIAACLARPWPSAPVSTLPMITSSTSFAATPAASNAATIATLSSSWACNGASAPNEAAHSGSLGSSNYDVGHWFCSSFFRFVRQAASPQQVLGEGQQQIFRIDGLPCLDGEFGDGAVAGGRNGGLHLHGF